MQNREKEVRLLNAILPYWRGPSIQPKIIYKILNSRYIPKDVITCARNISKEVRVLDEIKIGKWKIRCPYCETIFEVNENKVIKCPNCNSIIKKINFKEFSSLLEQYLNFEISKKDLLTSPVIPIDDSFELILEEDIPRETVNFRVSIYGFNTVYKFFSPLQLYTINKLTHKIRETDKSVRPILSLALLDYISYNSMFTVVNKKGIKSMFYKVQPRISWKWAILPSKYFVKSVMAVINAKEGIYVASLDYDLQTEIYNFYLSFLKRTLSNSVNGLLTPYLYAEHFFNCLDDACNSFVEKSKERLSFEDIIGNKKTFLLKIIKEEDIRALLKSKYKVLSVSYERKGFRISLGEGKSGTITLNELHSILKEKRIENVSDIEAIAKALEVVLKEFSKYERIIGVNSDITKEVFKEVVNILCNSINCNINDKMAKYYIIGKFYGRSKLFFRILYMISDKKKIKFTERSNNVLGLLTRVKKDPNLIKTLPASKTLELLQLIKILSNLNIEEKEIYKDILTKLENI
ncbi:hypothetical protein D1869_04285 [Sulfurisphaera ohwakuensis]|uniref:Uncharacterized protein n=1 Tax=Sulfurisphaera ohwakuensis TaxID=69656 RepID=A0A650CFF0_SULOH|nr:hypothetical protein D1869_04285 [Sulfurisphaera ohwakuensis]